MSDASSHNATNMDPRLALVVRRAFRVFNKGMLTLWRLDMARWFTVAPRLTGQIMVLHHTGRKTGLRRRTPLNYAIVDGALYCTAGFGHVAHWYRNIIATPQVEVWLPDGRWQGVAEDISEREDALALLRQVLIRSGFASFAAGINPYTLSDEALAEAARGYKLIHIRRETPLTGPGGPGDLAWVWQVGVMLLLPLALRRRR